MTTIELQRKARLWCDQYGYIVVAVTQNFIVYKRDEGGKAILKELIDFEERG